MKYGAEEAQLELTDFLAYEELYREQNRLDNEIKYLEDYWGKVLLPEDFKDFVEEWNKSVKADCQMRLV